MNKRFLAVILIILTGVTLIAVLASCSEASEISLSQEEYIVYLDEQPEFVPSVYVRPRGSSYTLTSSNTAVLEVLEDGKTLRALFPDAAATVTATSGGQSATARVIIYKERKVAAPPVHKETFTVVFNTFGRGSVPAQEINPGGTVTRPERYTHEDLVIVGWFTDEELEHEYDFTAPVTSDLTLYACWETGDATFQFVLREDGAYIKGLRYINIEYNDIIIPDEDESGNPVVGIEEKAFYRSLTGSKANIVKFKTVVIPATVKVIGKEAFTGITTLTAVYFDGESALTTIGDSAFQNCAKLAEFSIPSGVTSVGASAFSGDSSLNIQSLPAGLTVIAENAFNSTATVSVNLQNVTEIREQAFYNSKVGTILNSGNITKMGKNAFNNTPWWKAKISGGNKPVYLHDSILVAYYTSTPTAAFDLTVAPETRLVADSAFQNVTRSTIRFTTSTPPEFGSYVFNTESIIVVPENAIDAYGNKLTGFRYRLFTEKKILSDLDILVNDRTAAQNPTAVNVIIVKYRASEAPSQRLDIKTALYNMYPGREQYINIQRIKTAAFYDISNLATVVLPPRVYIIETNAFNKLPVFGNLTIEGEYGDYTPSKGKLENSAINPILAAGRDYFIYVPAGKLTAYKNSGTDSWGRYASRFAG